MAWCQSEWFCPAVHWVMQWSYSKSIELLRCELVWHVVYHMGLELMEEDDWKWILSFLSLCLWQWFKRSWPQIEKLIYCTKHRREKCHGKAVYVGTNIPFETATPKGGFSWQRVDLWNLIFANIVSSLLTTAELMRDRCHFFVFHVPVLKFHSAPTPYRWFSWNKIY